MDELTVHIDSLVVDGTESDRSLAAAVRDRAGAALSPEAALRVARAVREAAPQVFVPVCHNPNRDKRAPHR